MPSTISPVTQCVAQIAHCNEPKELTEKLLETQSSYHQAHEKLECHKYRSSCNRNTGGYGKWTLAGGKISRHRCWADLQIGSCLTDSVVGEITSEYLTLKEWWIPSSKIHRALFWISSESHQILQNVVQAHGFHWGFDQETFLRDICWRKTTSLQQMLQP